MTLREFRTKPWEGSHPAYRARSTSSILAPVAPEYSTGESLLGAAYRKLLLDKSEAAVDLEEIEQLPAQLGSIAGLPSEATWGAILLEDGGLSSPRLGGQLTTGGLPQLMPLVPEIARHACVIGRRRRRWDPGALLTTALASGVGVGDYRSLGERLRVALSVDNRDDVLARFLEGALQQLPDIEPRVAPLSDPVAPAWRASIESPLTPSERFCRDLACLIDCKLDLTRRQWTVLAEALLRVGLGAHMLWLCRLNMQVWQLVLQTCTAGETPSASEIERTCWTGHATVDPLLELGIDAIPALRKRVRDYSESRLCLNLLLHALAEAGQEWGESIGVPRPDESLSPSEKIRAFLDHVRQHRDRAVAALKAANFVGDDLRGIANAFADSRPEFLSGSSGPPRNLFFFLRYSLGQLQPEEISQQAYDQSYVLYKARRGADSPWPVRPGPASLILLVHSCCRAMGGAPASIDDFRRYLADYGISAPSGEIQGGLTGGHLERLGLVIDSPDAGGGRLLVDPL